MNDLVSLFEALLTPVVAIATVLIAYRQYRLEYLSSKRDLYDRRLEIFKRVMRFVALAPQSAAITREELAEFRSVMNEAQFLFGAEIEVALRNIYERAAEVWALEAQERETAPEDAVQLVYRARDNQMWLNGIDGQVVAAFRKYLSLVR